ncbi:MAG: hypothetical protein GWO24_09740, partial [Akkermansiaceae bacterium]|nr:hypothetical protein [Akkermansiaceae bacterium]
EELVELQIQMQNDMAVSSWISLVIGVVVSILILRAGLALVRRRKSGLKASNTYAWVSLAAKVAGLALFFGMVNPILNRTLEGFVDPSDPAA